MESLVKGVITVVGREVNTLETHKVELGIGVGRAPELSSPGSSAMFWTKTPKF